MAKYNFQKQAAGMKKLRDAISKAHRLAQGTLEEYILLGGEASVSGVERNLSVSMAQLDRMIKDCEGRAKLVKAGEYD
jgi:hypothetical protein